MLNCKFNVRMNQAQTFFLNHSFRVFTVWIQELLYIFQLIYLQRISSGYIYSIKQCLYQPRQIYLANSICRLQNINKYTSELNSVNGGKPRYFFVLVEKHQKIRPATRAYFQLLRRAQAFGRGFFCPSGKQTRAYYAILAHFWQFLVPRSNLGNFWYTGVHPCSCKSQSLPAPDTHLPNTDSRTPCHTCMTRWVGRVWVGIRCFSIIHLRFTRPSVYKKSRQYVFEKNMVMFTPNSDQFRGI